MRERLYCDLRSGVVAIYPESRKNDSPDICRDQDRIIAISNKGLHYNGDFWEMDKNTQEIFKDMVRAYNNTYL